MKNLSKIFVLFIATIMLVTMTTGCDGQKVSTPSEDKSTEAATGTSATTARPEGLVLTGYLNMSWFTPAKKWGNDPVTKLMKEELGFEVSWDVATEDSSEKLNMMLASQDLPDIVLAWESDFQRVITAKAVIPIEEYITPEGKLSNVTKALDKKYINLWRADDGHIYGVGGIFKSELRGEELLNYRRDILNKYGISVPKTLDELYEACKTIKSKDPSLIPVGCTNGVTINRYLIRSFMSAYGMMTYDIYGFDGEKPCLSVTDSRAREALLYLNKFYREGLLDQEVFINTKEQADAKLSSKVVFGLNGTFWDTDIWCSSDTSDETRIWWSAPPLRAVGYDGKVVSTGEACMPGWFVGITTKCKYVDAALEYLNWQEDLTNQVVLWYGIDPLKRSPEMEEFIDKYFITDEGRTFVEYTTEFLDERSKDNAGLYAKIGMFYNNIILNQNVEMQYQKMMMGIGTGYRPESYKMSREAAWDATPLIKMTPLSDTPEGIIFTKVQDIANQAIAHIVMSETEEKAKANYEQMLKDLEAAGLPQLQKYWEERCRKNLELMNQ